MSATLSPESIKAAQDEYERLRPTIEKKFPGQFIVIDPISKEYFTAAKLATALAAALAKYPGRQFYSTKIGGSAVVFNR